MPGKNYCFEGCPNWSQTSIFRLFSSILIDSNVGWNVQSIQNSNHQDSLTSLLALRGLKNITSLPEDDVTQYFTDISQTAVYLYNHLDVAFFDYSPSTTVPNSVVAGLDMQQILNELTSLQSLFNATFDAKNSSNLLFQVVEARFNLENLLMQLNSSFSNLAVRTKVIRKKSPN